MTREIIGALEEGAMDALRTYAVLIMAPFTVTKSLIARAKRTLNARGKSSQSKGATRRH